MTADFTPQKQRGFTLIEIMVVIVIIGFLASMAVLSSGTDPLRQLKQEAQRIAIIIRLAEDEALLQGKEYGLKLAKDSYQVVTFNETTKRWQSTADTSAFKHHRLPDNATLSLQSEGNKISLQALFSGKEKEQQNTENDPLKPSLLILSSGESTPFEIHFSSPDSTSYITLSGDGLNELELQTQHE